MTSKLHCGSIISICFSCSLLQTSNKVLVSHNVALFVTTRHITYTLSAKWSNVGQLTDCFDFMTGKSSITIPEFGETTCAEAVASLLVMLDFPQRYNCKFINENKWAIPKISNSDNFFTASVLCWWAEQRWNIVFGVNIGSLASPLLSSIKCLKSRR